MCGIVGYIGTQKSVLDILLNGLKKLEYRGYDSAGLAYVGDGAFVYERVKGEVKNLEEKIKKHDVKNGIFQVGIAHTRWATHGKPDSINAHPHRSGDIFVAHNGIIENYSSLKKELEEDGYIFASQTDSEVFAHLIHREYVKMKRKDLSCAVKEALAKVEGAYAIAVMCKNNKDELVVAKKNSPLVIGIINSSIGNSANVEYIVASDVSALIDYTHSVIYLDDGDVVKLTTTGLKFVQGEERGSEEIEYTENGAILHEYPHFMLQEIYEQGDVIKSAYSGRVNARNGSVVFDELVGILPKLLTARRIVIVSCGTSYHAGLLGEYIIEQMAGIPVEVEYASEFRYRDAPIYDDDIVLAISQSGETADTIAALQEAKRKGSLTLGIVNVVNSSIAREVDACLYTHAGPEISVASTKAFSSQVVILLLLAVMFGCANNCLSKNSAKRLLTDLEQLPDVIDSYIKDIDAKVAKIATEYMKYDKALFFGRDTMMPIALEGALKLKEISYVNSQGHASGELKHGIIALIDETMPSIVLAPKSKLYKKSLSALEEIKARGGRVLSITTEDAVEVIEQSDDVLIIPKIVEELLPLLSVIPLQLFAYHSAVVRGLPVDKPRNLAKSVTVE